MNALDLVIDSQEKIYDDIDEVIQIISNNTNSSRSPSFLWKQVVSDVHRQLLYKIADELKLSNPRLIASKFLEKHKFEFLNSRPLNGLYSYYKNRIPRKDNVHLITYVCDMLGIPPVNEDDWIAYICQYNIHSWGYVPVNVRKKVLLLACNELGYRHPIFMNYSDFSKPYHFLNEKTLTGFYNYYNTRTKGVRGIVIKNICDQLNISIKEKDWIEYITNSNVNTFWDVIPKEVIRNLLFKAVENFGYTNPRMMATEDLRRNIDFLNGMSFYSFASRFMAVEKNGVRMIDYICDLYEVTELTYNEWIYLATHQTNFRWERFPIYFLGKILIIKATEMGKENPRMLKYEDFATPCDFLSGKSLTGLYNYYSHVKESTEIDTVNYMCDIAQISTLTTEQWISIIGDVTTKVPWETVSNEAKKDILMKAAKELGLKNPRLMDSNDFSNIRFEFLNNKTLSGFYSYYKFKLSNEEVDQINILQYICDSLDIEKLAITDWIAMICNATMIRWDKIPLKVQREIVIRAAAELGLSNPRLMGTKEFDSIPFKFLKGKTLTGLYYHYAGKTTRDNNQITQLIMNTLNIPRIDIHPKTGRILTLDSSSHNKYFDSIANFKNFVDSYLQLFDLDTLCRKYTMIHNAKKAGIYIKGLITIIAPLTQREYIDLIYDTLKNTPRDLLGLRKPRNGDYRLLKSDLYELAGLETTEDEIVKIDFAKIKQVKEKSKDEVLENLKKHLEILMIKEKKMHQITCQFLLYQNDSAIFYFPVSYYPGDILTADTKDEFEVVECREHTTKDGYIVELKPLTPVNEEKVSEIKMFIKDSNETILINYMNRLIADVGNNSLPLLMSVVLGLKKEKQLSLKNIKQVPAKKIFNSSLLNNVAQKQAVDLSNTLDGKRNALAIVQGPPGTGKTTLIKEIALQHYRSGKNVLILAKTNVAVDNILEKLAMEKVRVLRTGNNIQQKSYLSYAQNISTSNPLYMLAIEEKNKIAFGTPLGLYLDKNLSHEQYDIVIIDEASQMDIPETLFAMGYAEKCVLIGDHLQIPPFPIPNEVFMEYNSKISLQEREDLQKSLFEELITDTKRYSSVFLDINYRTQNPKMVSFISDLVYDGKLNPDLETEYYQVHENKRKKIFPKAPIQIVDTADITEPHLRKETEVNSTYYNLTEAMLSVRKVIDLLKEGEKLTDICIITPYKAHMEKVQETFMKHLKYFGGNAKALEHFVEHNIYTIDSFQGREKKNVIINWVRSNYDLPGIPTKTGFLRDFRRVNVALSRAQNQLILIGDFETLTKSDNPTVRYMFKKILSLKNKNFIVY